MVPQPFSLYGMYQEHADCNKDTPNHVEMYDRRVWVVLNKPGQQHIVDPNVY